MREIRPVMGMPVEIEIVGEGTKPAVEDAFAYLQAVDERFSTYKDTSEISRINRGEFAPETASREMREVFAIAERTKAETGGYFDIRRPDGSLDPSGIVKGWAVKNAAARIRENGQQHFFVNAGGDIAMSGQNANGEPWKVGIRNPFATDEIVKVVYPKGAGIATSGSYLRGAHIYDPHDPSRELRDIVSLTVIGPDVLEADRYATAAFAMGKDGIAFIERTPGLEGYAITDTGTAIFTSGFVTYTTP
ncbi:MAG TPA: FAD:protein FMN transferase [Candidatus Paceibacterota bacterium]|nr:FAD:protein FMN transferase [Candidatus Paceibacterota bacterium]